MKFGLQVDFEYTYKMCKKNCKSEINVSLAELLRLCVMEEFNKHRRTNVHINIILMCVRVTIVAVEKPGIKYSGCVTVALVIQHAKRTLYFICICVLSGCTIFFHVNSQTA
jgi:hypothetical protein